MASGIYRRKQAKADVDSIWAHVAANNLKAAEDLLQRFSTIFEMLLRNPQAGCPRPELGHNLRSFAVENYTIFYIPQSDGAVRKVGDAHSKARMSPRLSNRQAALNVIWTGHGHFRTATQSVYGRRKLLHMVCEPLREPCNASFIVASSLICPFQPETP